MTAKHIIDSKRGLATLLVLLSTLPSCQRGQIMTTVDERIAVTKAGEPMLPKKSFNRLSDGSLEITGHWKWKAMKAPGGKMPFGAQTLNSTIIRCWPSNQTCEEYRAQISNGILFSLEPLRFRIVSSDGSKTLATCDLAADTRLQFEIDAGREHMEMLYRREPSPGRDRVFQRWVLE